MEKKKITAEMREQLKAPFEQKAYKKHPTKTFLTTLKAMYIVERLNDVFGLGLWKIEHTVEMTTPDYVLISGKLILTEYISDITSQYGGHKITGKNTEIADGYKSAITDCLSKTASYLEIGIEMFKGNINVNGGSTYSQPTIPPPQRPILWLTDAKYKKALTFGISDLEKLIKIYSTPEKQMKKVWKANLDLRVLEMKNELNLAEQQKKEVILKAK